MKRTLTVIIPVKNRAVIVPKTLESVYNQITLPDQLILVDNGSDDNTMEVLESWRPKFEEKGVRTIILSEPEPGAPAARNAGLAVADGEWTMFFDSDDVMRPNHIARAMQCVKESRNVDIVAWPVTMKLLNGRRKKGIALSDKPYYDCVMGGAMATQRYMARTQLFKDAGAWDNNVEVWNDIELGVRMLNLNPRIKTLKGTPTVLVYAMPDSITGIRFSDKSTQREHAIDLIESNLPDNAKWTANLKRAVLAGNYYKEGKRKMARSLMSDVDGTDKEWSFIRLSFSLTKRGIPGATRIVRMFLS